MYGSEEDAERGKRRGGSGFLVAQPSRRLPPGLLHLYAVTNAHVIERGGTVARAGTSTGETRIFSPSPSDWRSHPDGDDVAICHLGTVPKCTDMALQWLPRDCFVTEKDFGLIAAREDYPWEMGPIVAGEDVFTVGRFVGYDGIEQNQPVVRFGNLSSPETMPVEQPPRHRSQDSFLVEARSLGGQSGAPVFAYRLGGTYGGASPSINDALLLGIGWGHIKHPSDERAEYDVEMQAPGMPTPGRYNAGIMAVVPAWKLAELLDSQKVMMMREELEEKLAAPSDVEFDSADDRDEFDRFEDLTGKLLKVPKKELDAKRREQEGD